MSWHLSKKPFAYEIILILLFVVIYSICRIFNITCLIYAVTKIPCPTCYMGRAICSVLKGNFQQYVAYNMMAIPVASVFILELFNVYFRKYKNIIHGYSIIILIFNMIYYIIRMRFIFWKIANKKVEMHQEFRLFYLPSYDYSCFGFFLYILVPKTNVEITVILVTVMHCRNRWTRMKIKDTCA